MNLIDVASAVWVTTSIVFVGLSFRTWYSRISEMGWATRERLLVLSVKGTSVDLRKAIRRSEERLRVARRRLNTARRHTITLTIFSVMGLVRLIYQVLPATLLEIQVVVGLGFFLVLILLGLGVLEESRVDSYILGGK